MPSLLSRAFILLPTAGLLRLAALPGPPKNVQEWPPLVRVPTAWSRRRGGKGSKTASFTVNNYASSLLLPWGASKYERVARELNASSNASFFSAGGHLRRRRSKDVVLLWKISCFLFSEAWVRRLAGGGGRGWCEAGVAAGLLVVASASLFCEREDQAALSGTRNTFRLPLILCTMTRRKHRALQGCVRTRSPQYSYRRGEKNT